MAELTFQTVTGAAAVGDVWLADAHEHLWIKPPEGIPAEVRFELSDEAKIRAELSDFRQAGGTTLIDCQPGGCGRDANRLIALSRATGLQVTATTGFHQQKYYPPGYWLWSASVYDAADYFIEELTVGMRESSEHACASTIKVGYEGVIEGQSRTLMEAAALAAAHTGALILFHTEQGRGVEALLPFFADRKVSPERLYLCHVDKRPDAGLHRELAQAGVLLGYDTFARPKYDPDRGAWRLLRELSDAGLDEHIAIGLDMASASMWRHYGGEPGLLMLTEAILPRLRREGFSEDSIARLTGQNIARTLVRRIDS